MTMLTLLVEEEIIEIANCYWDAEVLLILDYFLKRQYPYWL